MGAGPGEISRWGLDPGVPRPPEKLQRTSNTIVLPSAPDFQDLVQHLSNWYCPWAYSTAVSHPSSTSQLWTVGIASVGTESVGIVWCTPSL